MDVRNGGDEVMTARTRLLLYYSTVDNSSMFEDFSISQEATGEKIPCFRFPVRKHRHTKFAMRLKPE